MGKQGALWFLTMQPLQMSRHVTNFFRGR